MPTSRQQDPRNPRSEREAAHDEDKHGRKKNSGTNQPTRREAGSARDAEREGQPRCPSDSTRS